MESSNASGEDDLNDCSGNLESGSVDDLGNDAEGVWSADIEQSFQEALSYYPPCGRRKIILSDEGKMYGRNELIARYIKLKTGKVRSRKQVSSHIQVLARRKSKEIQSQLKDLSSKEKVLHSLSTMSSSQIVSSTVLSKPVVIVPQLPTSLPPPPPLPPQATNLPQGFADYTAQLWNPNAIAPNMRPPYMSPGYPTNKALLPLPSEMVGVAPPWQGRSIAGPKLRLVEFSAFAEKHKEGEGLHRHFYVHIGNNVMYSDPILESVDIGQISDKFPSSKGGLKDLFDKGPSSAFFLVKFWADINTTFPTETDCFHGISSMYESTVNMQIQISTILCSFGKQVVEKVEMEHAVIENCRFVYRTDRSPMCEYLVNFIHKLKTLPKKDMMDSVLENFTILQVILHRETLETLLCVAYVFEVSKSESGSQHQMYRLIKE